MISNILDKPRFALYELILAVICGAAWFLYPQVGWSPLILWGILWGIRLAAGSPPIARTRFDLALVFFLLTAAVGVWATYDRQAGWEKFWVIVGAILVFYALARQPRENLWSITALISLIGSVIAMSFLFGHDWQAQPTGIGLIDQLGERWMGWRPALTIPSLPPNQTGGLLGMQLPLAVALALHPWVEPENEAGSEKKTLVTSILAVLAVCLMGLGLLMTSSRGAMLALLVSSGLWGLWWISGYLTRRMPVNRDRFQSRVVSFLVVIGFIGALVLIFTVTGGGLVELADRLPGVPSGESRVELAQDAFHLIDDFWFTGAGLESFSGLYSQYIMGTPFFLYRYTHNFYLDVALEQGILGFLALTFVLAVSIYSLGKQALVQPYGSRSQLLIGALIASLLTVILHGFVDDALYGNEGTPFLFLLAGLAIAVDKSVGSRIEVVDAGVQVKKPRDSTSRLARINDYWMLVVVVVIIGVIAWWRNPLAGGWYANLGALEMARVELAGFPAGKWDEGENITALEPATGYFESALQLDPTNQTARHRLGLIAAMKGDYSTAITQLEKAYTQSPTHRGIRKALGYSYAWSGETQRASQLFKDLPETLQELKVYVGWWEHHDRRDLSDQAKILSAYMESASE